MTSKKAKADTAAAELVDLREKHGEACARLWIAKALNRPEAYRLYEAEMLCRARVMKAEQRMKKMEGKK